MNKVYPWRKTLHRWSTYFWGAIVLLPPAWMFIPAEWKQAMIDKMGTGGLFAFSVLAFTGYVVTNIKQKNLGEKNDAGNGSPES